MSISRRGHDLGCACHVGISDVAVLPREEAACDTTVESAIEVRFANHEEMTIVASHTECLKVCYHQKSKQCILPWIFCCPFPITCLRCACWIQKSTNGIHVLAGKKPFGKNEKSSSSKNQTSIVFTWLFFEVQKMVMFFFVGGWIFWNQSTRSISRRLFCQLALFGAHGLCAVSVCASYGCQRWMVWEKHWLQRVPKCCVTVAANLLEKCLAQLIHPLKWLIREWIWMGVYLDSYLITCLCPSPRNRFFALGSNLIAISGSLTSISKDYQTSCWSNQISRWFKLCIKFRKGCVYVSTSEACNTWLWAVL